MKTHRLLSRWFAHAAPLHAFRCGGAIALLLLGLMLPPTPPASAAEDTPVHPEEAWPTSVRARFRLSYNGIDVGVLDVNSKTTGDSYSITGSGRVSVLFGLFKWTGSSHVTGTIDNGTPVPAAYAFEIHPKKVEKSVSIRIGYIDRTAADVAIKPAPRRHTDMIPLVPEDKAGALDPLSAIMMLTKTDGRPPCDRRVNIFDGTQRYDIVFSPKRQTRMPPLSGKGAAEAAYVCRITYVPVAGHRDNADTKAYAANRDVEVLLRRIPGSKMYIPYSVTIPTTWGTGTMVAERLDVVTSAGKIALAH